ncbi:unnamed protein product [Paramecium primaurelia]|uniref:Uncharacterized protein n=1 Tax=Paramecium primaurelia TaxID=5886 RepID=A0A8S1JRE1_PARPR|nr:unnamed protein product [Paramecium primaurelia]
MQLIKKPKDNIDISLNLNKIDLLQTVELQHSIHPNNIEHGQQEQSQVLVSNYKYSYDSQQFVLLCPVYTESQSVINGP